MFPAWPVCSEVWIFSKQWAFLLPTRAFGKHIFLPWGPKYTFQSGLIVRVHLKVPRFRYSPKPWGRRSTLLWLCWVLWSPYSLTENKYLWLKNSWNKLFQAVCCFGLHYRLLFLRVKHGESCSSPASAALALPTQPVLSFINQSQRLEHCGCALLDILSIAAAPQPSLKHRQCRRSHSVSLLQDPLLISLLVNK